jgi:anaphase-promoting complex subunit 6
VVPVPTCPPRRHLYENAIFFADKLVTLSGGEPDDVYRLAQAYVFTKQFRRALQVLNKTKQATASSRFRYLTAKCLAECNELDDCLSTLDDDALRAVEEEAAAGDGSGGQVQMLAAMHLLKGSVYESQENWPLAARCYTAALHADALCYEALDRLVDNHMMSASEQRELLEQITPKLQGEGAEWLLMLYGCRLEPEYGKQLADTYAKRAGEGDEAEVGGDEEETGGGGGGGGGGGDGSEGGEGGPAAVAPAVLELRDNCDMLTAAAEYEYAHDHFRRCYSLSCRVLKRDPFQRSVLPVHICCMMRLDYHAELFYLAHQLVEEYPSLAVSWYAVGCYYHMIADFENARRYFSKSTTIDHRFAPAWLGFGHAFAAQDESDQAMAAYRTASRLFPGSHIPWLGIGMEYLRTNHLHLALQYIRQAQQICPMEPLVLHELGVLNYLNGEYDDAVAYFRLVAENCHDYDDAVREPSIFNLGHAYRKKGEYENAARWYRAALAINPRIASTYSALGFALHLNGELDEAIELYHQSLSLKPDDTFTCEMLSEALKDTLEAGFTDPAPPGGSAMDIM